MCMAFLGELLSDVFILFGIICDSLKNQLGHYWIGLMLREKSVKSNLGQYDLHCLTLGSLSDCLFIKVFIYSLFKCLRICQANVMHRFSLAINS